MSERIQIPDRDLVAPAVLDNAILILETALARGGANVEHTGNSLNFRYNGHYGSKSQACPAALAVVAFLASQDGTTYRETTSRALEALRAMSGTEYRPRPIQRDPLCESTRALLWGAFQSGTSIENYARDHNVPRDVRNLAMNTFSETDHPVGTVLTTIPRPARPTMTDSYMDRLVLATRKLGGFL